MNSKRRTEIREELEFYTDGIEKLLDELGEKYNELKYLRENTEKDGKDQDGRQKFKSVHYIEYDGRQYKISNSQWLVIKYIKDTKSAANYQFNAVHLISNELPFEQGIDLEERFNIIFRYQKELYKKLFIKLDNKGSYRMNIK